MSEKLWLEAVAEATKKTIGAIAGLPIEVKSKKDISSLDPLEGTVSSLLVFEGKKMKGQVLLSFPPATFKMIVERIMQEEIVVEKNYSFANEMLNMIYGGIKTSMNKHSFELGLARPSLVLEKVQLPEIADQVAWLVPFFIEEGKGFFIVLLLKEIV